MSGSLSTETLSIGVLISGGGATLANLIERIGAGRLERVRIATVISSRAGVAGVGIARAAGLPLRVIRTKDYGDRCAFSAAIADALMAADVTLVAMAGFLCFWEIPNRYRDRTLNIHPALLPAFDGRGMYGRRVHEAVLASGTTESGCTVHLADERYDHGPIVAQERVPVEPGDTPESLAGRVRLAEHELYPRVLQQVADNGVCWLDRFAHRSC